MKNKILFACVALGMVGLILYPAEAAAAVRDGLRICGLSVIPALFPFFVLTKFHMATRRPKQPSARLDGLMQKCFGVGGNGCSALLLSFLGGYPVGVSTAVSLYDSGALTKRETEHLLRFCNNSGPAFFVGIVGGVVLQDVRLGLCMFGAHILAAICCGLLFSEGGAAPVRVKRATAPPCSASDAFLQAVSASCASLLQISGLILCFSVVLALLEASGGLALFCKLPLGLSPKELAAVLSGLLELSSGILRLQNTAHAPTLAAFLMGWGGLCVHMQAMNLWRSAKLRPKGYFLSKLLHGLLSALFMQTILTPTAEFLLVSAFGFGLCLVFRKKRGGNLRRVAV